uniref:DedA family protein n=1 Tax=Vaginimicrobium propionicum TaxID=1871034 RepID=UPI002F919755
MSTDSRFSEDKPQQEPSDGNGDVELSETEEAAAEEERPWWDDPSMPWKHEPGRADIACLAWIGFLGVFSLAMLPLRAWLLGAPERLPWLVALLGSRSGTTALGSVVSTGGSLPWVWPILLGTLMSIKLDWTYWWAGKLWGRGMIEVWAGQSERATRNYERAERWAKKMGWVGMFVAYVPIPLPIMPVVFVLAGASGMSWKKFVALDFISALLWLLVYFAFGMAVGEPAVQVLTWYSKVANWVAIALVAAVVILSINRARKKTKTA